MSELALPQAATRHQSASVVEVMAQITTLYRKLVNSRIFLQKFDREGGVLLCVPLNRPASKQNGLMILGHGRTRMNDLPLCILNVRRANLVTFHLENRPFFGPS